MIKVAEAIGDENGKSSGGERGDQTGKELLVRTFKKRSYAFTQFLRCTDRAMAKRAAEYAIRIASCAKFGYNQKARWSGPQAIELVGPEHLEQADPGDFDCSSFVIECYRMAGCPLQMTGYTGNIAKLLMATGCFKEMPSDSDPLAGDVWNAPGKHSLMVVSGGVEPDPEPTPAPKTETVVYVKGENVRIRTGPSTDYPTVMIAHRGQTYPYVSTDKGTGWYWIETVKGTDAITGKSRYTELREKRK